ncbi:type II toxin-antitoxin system Rv0910 family toxin [Rhodococcoides kroppenstedtii]|uniref:type II toxin-antitoxin system Rv0910 family toxin n=1 Tax=Rhodococcoides kroppenstedtii TaxID=293050 RepID=UPI0028EE7767|nr:SRPBCC family protein [Rhodococcus kroppenstedtii]
MAGVNVSVESTMTPDEAWARASDLSGFDEWMTIFGGWRSPIPTTLHEGVTVDSLIKVKGFRNVITWTIAEYDKPHEIALLGTGKGGVKIDLRMTVTPKNAGSTFTLEANFRGGLLSGPIGTVVAKVLESDVRDSVTNLAKLG